MNKTLTFIGLVLTFVYALVFYWGIEGRLSQIKTMELNNLGDFFAGAFGPIAILWLILGFFQQGKELKQNTEALELQAKELKNSVDAQNNIAIATKLQYEHDLNIEKMRGERFIQSLRPDFIIQNSEAQQSPLSNSNIPNMEILIKIKNVGGNARNIKADTIDERLEEIHDWHHHSCDKNTSISYWLKIKAKSLDTPIKTNLTYEYGEIGTGNILIEHSLLNAWDSGEVISTILRKNNYEQRENQEEVEINNGSPEH